MKIGIMELVAFLKRYFIIKNSRHYSRWHQQPQNAMSMFSSLGQVIECFLGGILVPRGKATQESSRDMRSRAYLFLNMTSYGLMDGPANPLLILDWVSRL
jgi:hypothetical protein